MGEGLLRGRETGNRAGLHPHGDLLRTHELPEREAARAMVRVSQFRQGIDR
jgi:hypothetical protein